MRQVSETELTSEYAGMVRGALDGTRPRVVSLLASATEIVCALGMGECLVGRSHECDWPEWVRRLPVVSAPAFAVTGTSIEIDREVRRRVEAGEPLYRIDAAEIEALGAEILFAQEHCEVCAVTPGDVARAGCVTAGAQVMALTAGTLEGIFVGMERVAEALGVAERGRALVAAERERLRRVGERCAGRVAPTVVVMEWADPVFAMGNWGPELVEAANGRLLLGRPGEHSQAIEWACVREADPEFLVIAPCGYDRTRAEAELPLLRAREGWSELRAVREGRVAVADGNRYFNRSGMTVVETAEILAEMLHGVVVGERTEGVSWRWVRA